MRPRALLGTAAIVVIILAAAGCGESDGAAVPQEPDIVSESVGEAAAEQAAIETQTEDSGEMGTALKDLFSEYFRIGVAVQAIDHWNDPTAEIGNPYKEALILEEFNSITFGNEWKPAYNFDKTSETLYTVNPAAEELLKWADENGMPVRGHTLIWHSQCDPAIFAADFKATSKGQETHDWNAVLDDECLVDKETLKKRLRTYIRGVMEYTYKSGFADTVYAFDVINEATDEAREDGLRDSYYYRIIGPEYLYLCFFYAREAETEFAGKYAHLYGLDADRDDLSPIMPKLFYNDYNEWFDRRVETIVRFVKEDRFNEGGRLIKSPLIPEDGDGTIAGDGLIDGIGMQGHLDDTQNIDVYIKALRIYDETVDEVQITELDVGETGAGQQAHVRQAVFYHEFFKSLIDERRSGVNLTAVTFWGLTDDASWRHGANPLLFEGDLSQKPAVSAITAAAMGEDFEAEDVLTARDSSALSIDFEPQTDGAGLVFMTPENLGFKSRGSGHQASLKIVNDENHTEGAAVGRSLKARREERDASVRLDISRFIGERVRISVWVKTEDKEAALGLAAQSDTELVRAAGGGEWIELSAEAELDEGLSSASVYIETDGSADIFIDDVSVETADP